MPDVSVTIVNDVVNVDISPQVTQVAVVDPTPVVVTVAGSQGPAGANGADGAGAPTAYTITNASSFSVSHGKSYSPDVWLLDDSNALVDTDVLYAPGQVTLVFPSPFTGKLFIG